MQCHEVDYKIIGDDMKIVEVELDPGETVIAEAGAMNYMDDGITFEARMVDRILQHAPKSGRQPQRRRVFAGRAGGSDRWRKR